MSNIKRLLCGVLTLFYIISSIPLMAQTTSKIQLSAKEFSLDKLIKEIENKTDYTFVFDNTIDLKQKVNTISSGNISEILKQAFNAKGISFEFMGKQIILKKELVPIVKKRQITGSITDESGEPLIGASIMVKGTSIGTITDLNGTFSLTGDLSDKSILLFSYIGMNSKEIQIGRNTIFNVVLESDTKTLEEVVVVGYGTQKKLNITGAIDVVSSNTLEKMPVSSITQSLQGSVPGIIITDGGGKPGTALSINVRGQGTLGSTEPLVVIDGIPTGIGDFNILNPNDVESISVLKDASSAAIYGSRAANGVLVVTTKRGNKEQKPVINFSYNYSTQTPTKVPEMLNSWEYAELRNEQLTNSDKMIQFTPENIELMKNGMDPDNFANVNWWDQAVKSHNDLQNVNLRISGGNTKMNYMVSGGYTSQNGLIDYTDFKKYNARANLNIQIIENLDASANISYYRDETQVPYNYDRFFSEVMNMAPYVPVKKQNGDWGHLNNETTNPIAWIRDGGYRKSYDENLSMSISANWEILKGLKLKGQAAYNHWTPGHTEISKTIEMTNEDGSQSLINNPNGVSRQFVTKNLIVLQGLLDYERQFGAHNIHGLLGYSDEHYKSSWVGGWRWYIPDNSMEEIDGATGSGDAQGTWGSSDEWRMRSYFGRVNYAFAGKYFVEGNFRYDGSSRLAPGHHYTFFPSGSLGWRISEEPFMNFSRKYLDNLKLRVSYGQLGNQSISLYQYAEVIITDPKGYMFGHQWVPSSYIGKLPNTEIGWEISNIFNIGFDLGFFNSRLSATFDWYNKHTKDILLDVPVSSVIGIPVSVQNAGKMKNWGWELLVGWKDQVNKFSYSATFSLSDQRNEIIDLKGTGPFKGDRTITQEGYALNTLYAYVADGFYTSEEEIASSPKFEGYASQLKVGDIKYKDISGPNGTPDGKIDSYDKTYVGWSAPRFMYGLDLTAEWKGVDLRAFFQGVGKRDEYVHGQIIYLSGGFKHIQKDRWDPARSVEDNLKYAKYPRLTDGQGNNYEMSTFWKHNAAYLRLKNFQIGYTLPKKWTSKITMERVRFYFSGNNLFTITKFPYVDPEGSSDGAYYPQLKTFSFGVDITIGKN